MKLFSSILVTTCLAGSIAAALPVNGTGNVTNDAIFGSGNANGSFTGVTENGVELGLRGKLRYDTNGQPQNTFNYDGDRTYTFTTAEGNAPADRSVFNYEFSINVDPDGQQQRALSDLTYLLEIDFDPTAATSFVSADPINVLWADHSFGTNATGNGDGVEALGPITYAVLSGTNNLVQNSWNLGFDLSFYGLGAPSGFDPQTEGMFTIQLSAFDGQTELASTAIDIVYGAVPNVPLPASLPLLAAGFAGLGALARRRRRAA